MIKTQVGTQQNGSPRYNFEFTQEEMDAGHVALKTGPLVSGVISVPDASSPDGNAMYDITDDFIAVKAEHLPHVHQTIHRMHHAAGRFLDVPVPSLEELTPKPPEEAVSDSA